MSDFNNELFDKPTVIGFIVAVIGAIALIALIGYGAWALIDSAIGVSMEYGK